MSPNTQVPTILDIQNKAMLLPGRPQFWTSHHMAEFYQTNPSNLVRQFRRNPDRFPADFWFELREVEKQVLVSHFGAPNRVNRGVMVGFTHAGALALSGVLKTSVADAVSVQIIRAVVAMEAKAIADANYLMQKMRNDYTAKKPIMGRIVDAVAQGWNFEMLAQSVSLSKPKLVLAIQDALNLGLIPKAPDGTPFEKAPNFVDPRQMGLFPNV